MTKAVKIEDLPEAMQAQAYRQVASQLEREGKVAPPPPAVVVKENKTARNVGRFIAHTSAYILLGVGRFFMWSGKHIEAGGENLLTWLRQQDEEDKPKS
jgi:hypothetical protein